jgi:hypothetical protein
LRSIQRVNQSFSALFGKSDGEESGGEGDSSEFDRSYGWIYNCKMVAEFEGISLNEAWELPVLQFLNDLSYLKVKRKLDGDQQKRLLKQHR